MPGFSVSVPAVDALSFRVATAASDVRAAQGRVAASACVDLGYPDLTGAFSSYAAFWQQFTDGTAAQVDATAAAVAGAAASYATVDATAIADPSLTQAVVTSALSGGSSDATLQLLAGPLLGSP